MGADGNLDWKAAAASALDWWAEAGVDLLVEEAPRDWLAPLRAPSALAPTAPAPVAAPAMPDTLEAFTAWRGGAAAPEAGWPGVRVSATGDPAAGLMVLVDCPDRDDVAGGLLSGASGRLFDRMLAAIGRGRESIYLASLCLARPAAGRVPREVEQQLGELARAHLGLVAPRRLLVLGNAASRAVLATDVLPARGRLHDVNHRSGHVGVVASFHPRLLLDRPQAKAEAWADLQMLIRGWDQ